MEAPNKTLYNKLVEQGLYTKSYDEFQKQFAGHDRVMTLFSALKEDGHYTKSAEEFKTRFFSPVPETIKKQEVPERVSIRDARQVEMATGATLSDKSRFHAEADTQHIQQVTATARKYGINPYTALAINLAETRFAQEQRQNPFQLGNYDQYGDVIDQSMKFLSEKQAYAKKLGKKNEADIIQAWNGYGTLSGRGNMYGIDTNTKPINMSDNPVYGKRIIDLRDNVIKKNPDVTSLVENVMSGNPQFDYQYYK